MPATGKAAIDVVRSCRRIVILTEGYSDQRYSKTAAQLLRYRREEVVAIFDSGHAGSTADSLFGLGGDTPVIGSFAQAPPFDSLFFGIAPPGGAMPPSWQSILCDAVRSGAHIVSGLHTSLHDDPSLVALAQHHEVSLVNLRACGFSSVASQPGFNPECVRVHTVGTDCSVGKMSAAKEIELGLLRSGRDARFVATGQTGVMISGGGITIDGVVSDFVNGAAERLVLDHQHHEILVIEGQGSIVHPAFSSVTTGLMHGAAPDALILCHEFGRENHKGLDHVPLWPLLRLAEFYETVASARHPCRVIGVALNGRRTSAALAADEQLRLENELKLPVCDVYRDGPERLVEAVELFDRQLRAERSVPRIEQPSG